jgi:hypothetical protein
MVLKPPSSMLVRHYLKPRDKKSRLYGRSSGTVVTVVIHSPPRGSLFYFVPMIVFGMEIKCTGCSCLPPEYTLALHPANVTIAGEKNVVVGGFCPTITEMNLKQYPYLYNRKKWTGWDLNPRPQWQ